MNPPKESHCRDVENIRRRPLLNAIQGPSDKKYHRNLTTQTGCQVPTSTSVVHNQWEGLKDRMSAKRKPYLQNPLTIVHSMSRSTMVTLKTLRLTTSSWRNQLHHAVTWQYVC